MVPIGAVLMTKLHVATSQTELNVFRYIVTTLENAAQRPRNLERRRRVLAKSSHRFHNG